MYTYMTNIVFRTIIISFKFTFNLNYNILLCYKGNGEFHECTFFIEIYQFWYMCKHNMSVIKLNDNLVFGNKNN